MPRLNIQGCIFLKKEGDSHAMTDDITITWSNKQDRDLLSKREKQKYIHKTIK